MSVLLPVKGVYCSSVSANIKKNNELDLSVILFAKKSKVAGVFTKNVFCAAPVIVAKDNLKKSPLAFLINSGNANAGNGKTGMANAIKSCEILAKELNIKTNQILPFSTGVIGQQLDLSKFSSAIPKAVDMLSLKGINDVAKGILTTDTVEKTVSKQFEVNGKTVTISGVAKGSGMICPNMATMLSFIFTDIKAKQEELQACLNITTAKSFNRITVDGDTSTNDACMLVATGLSDVDISDCRYEFNQAIEEVAKTLAHKIIKDGEGATKFVEICVTGGNTSSDCLKVAYTVAHSPLVKTAIFASDANWGRILAAIGRTDIQNLNIQDINIYINKVQIVKFGELDKNYTEDIGSVEMKKKSILITIDIGNSELKESVWTTDFSYDYIKINAEYRS